MHLTNAVEFHNSVAAILSPLISWVLPHSFLPNSLTRHKETKKFSQIKTGALKLKFEV